MRLSSSVTGPILLAVSLLVLPSSASAAEAPPEPLGHDCLLTVEGVDEQGNFVLSEPECYDTFAEVLEAQGNTSPSARSATAETATPADLERASIIGTHWDGTNGTGASVSVSGSDCNGGGLNVTTTWENRISSTTNGCGRIAHYENANYGGIIFNTYNAGVTSNITGSMNNNTSSIKYFAS